MHALASPQRQLRPVVYPDSDGQPMAENTLQYEWIVTIKGGLDTALPDFVAGDLLWYPVEGQPDIRVAPDVLVALGRPKGYRGSYRQWEEEGIAPQVVFEVLSPGNRYTEMVRKLNFYQRYGVQEYYVYDPDSQELVVYRRQEDRLEQVESPDGWVSPLLGIRFQTAGGTFRIFHRNDKPFLTFTELTELANRESQRADEALVQAEAERRQAEAERRRADENAARVAALEARLRTLGLDPES